MTIGVISDRTGSTFVTTVGICAKIGGISAKTIETSGPIARTCGKIGEPSAKIGSNSGRMNYPEQAPGSYSRIVGICGRIGERCKGIGGIFDRIATSAGWTGAISTRTGTRGEWIGKGQAVVLIRAWDVSLEPVLAGLRSRSSPHYDRSVPRNRDTPEESDANFVRLLTRD